MTPREMRARLLASYGNFVFFPNDPEVSKLIGTRAFTHLIIEDEIKVYAPKAMEEDLENIKENYEIIYGEPELKGEYYVSPHASISNLKFPYKDGTDILMEAMRKPFPEEISLLISLGEIIQEALRAFFNEIEIGMKEKEAKAILEYHLLRRGVDSFLYPSIVVCGEKSKKVFPKSGDEKIQERTIVYIDSSPSIDGYYLNFSRVILTEERKNWIDAIKRINAMYAKLSSLIKSGVSCNRVDEIVREVGEFPHYSVMPTAGFYRPYAPSNDILEENMVFTVVPSIYTDKGVIRVKRNILVEKEAIKFLD